MNELLALSDSLNKNILSPYNSLNIQCNLEPLNGKYVLERERLVHGRPLYRQEIPVELEETRNPLFLWYVGYFFYQFFFCFSKFLQ